MNVGGDVRYALRTLRKNPAFTGFAVLTLALGLGASAVIFSFLDGILLRPLRYPDPEQVVALTARSRTQRRQSVSAPDFLDWKAQATSFQGLAARHGEVHTLGGEAEPRLVRTWCVSAGYFELLGVSPVLGRGFTARDAEPGQGGVALLSHRFWKMHFGGDPGVLGRVVALNGAPGTFVPHTVVGVLPADRGFDRGWGDLWVPAGISRDGTGREVRYLDVVGRLAPGVSVAQAQAEMDAVTARIEQQDPGAEKGWGAAVEPLGDVLVEPPLRTSLLVLMGAVGTIVLIACANVSNLLLARAAGRRREIAVRTALGASRGRLVRQLLTESLTLSALGAAAGLLLAYGAFQVALAQLPASAYAAELDVRMDGRVLAFTTALTVLSALLFGLAPALQLSRDAPAGELKDGGRGAGGSAAPWARRTLMSAQVALAFVLLFAAGLLVRSLDRRTRVDLGFDAEDVVTMGVPLVVRAEEDGSRLTTYLDQAIERVRAVPGVRAAAFTSTLPLEGWFYVMPFRVDGAPSAGSARCGFKVVTPGYFETLSLAVRRGRALSTDDVSGAMPAVLINEALAQRHFAGVDPIGRRLLIDRIVPGRREHGPTVAWQIVGIVANESDRLDNVRAATPGVYVTYAQSPVDGVFLAVKGADDAAALVKPVQRAVWQVDKGQTFDDVRLLADIRASAFAADRLRAGLLGAFAALALILASTGIYGVLSYLGAQRRPELAVRAALGASSRELAALVLRSAARPIGIGVAAGAVGALGAGLGLRTLLFETSPADPATALAVGLLLAGVAFAACYLPAHRASRTDPMTALRHE